MAWESENSVLQGLRVISATPSVVAVAQAEGKPEERPGVAEWARAAGTAPAPFQGSCRETDAQAWMLEVTDLTSASGR